jgi:small subunit ribosomal protein S21
MLIIPIKEGETVDKALKKFKKKFEKTGVVRELRERKQFTKPSVRYREGKKGAIYKLQLQRQAES